MTQGNILVSPTLSACPKSGSTQWSAFQTRLAGDTVTFPPSGNLFAAFPRFPWFDLSFRDHDSRSERQSSGNKLVGSGRSIPLFLPFPTIPNTSQFHRFPIASDRSQTPQHQSQSTPDRFLKSPRIHRPPAPNTCNTKQPFPISTDRSDRFFNSNQNSQSGPNIPDLSPIAHRPSPIAHRPSPSIQYPASPHLPQTHPVNKRTHSPKQGTKSSIFNS
jgi:hypothetical protein